MPLRFSRPGLPSTRPNAILPHTRIFASPPDEGTSRPTKPASIRNAAWRIIPADEINS